MMQPVLSPYWTLLKRKAAVVVLWIITLSPVTADPLKDLMEMSLEQLLDYRIVTLDRTPHRITDLPATAYTLDASEIRAMGYNQLSDALEHLPSVEYTNPHSWLQGGLRGFADNWSKVKLLIDGEDINLLYTGEAFIGHQFPLFHLDRIEVIPGPASVTYGADAYTGVINLISRDIQGFETGSLYQTGDRGFQESTVYANWGYQTGAWKFYANAHYLSLHDADFGDFVTSENFSIPYLELRKELMDSGNYPYEDRNESWSIRTGAKWEISGTSRLNIDYTRLYDRDGGGQESPEISFKDFYSKRDQQKLSLKYRFESTDDRLTLDLNYSYRLDDEFNRFNFREPVDGELSPLYSWDLNGSRSDAFNLDIRFEPSPNMGQFLLGLGYEERNLVIPYFELDTMESLTPFLHPTNTHYYFQYSRTWQNRVDAFAGIRRDIHSIYDDPQLIRSGIRFKLSEQWNLKLLYGESFRAPTLFELEINETLDPSYMDAYELSLNYQNGESIWLQMAYYENHASDLIINRQIIDSSGETDLFSAFNEGKKTIRGIETEMRYFYKTGQVVLWATQLWGENTDDLSRRKMGFRWMQQVGRDLSMGVSIRYSGPVAKPYNNARGEVEFTQIPEYWKMDLNLEYFLNKEKNARVWIKITNLTNNSYYYPNVRGLDPIQFLALGRTFTVGVTKNW